MEKNLFEAIADYLYDHHPTETAPVYNDYISIAMAHQGIIAQLEKTLISITGSNEANAKSPVFTKLCLWRFTKTGKFNSVIAGEMALETGQDLETILNESGIRFRANKKYSNRLPYDYLGRDGDFIDGTHYLPRKKEQ